MSDSGWQPPEWDTDLYAERVAGFVEMNTNNTHQGPTVPRHTIAKFVGENLDGSYVDEAIAAALERDRIVERDEGRYALAE